MADRSAIEWTDATWNPITGCSLVSPGCTNCYAMRLAGTRLQHHPSRAGLTIAGKAGPVWNGTVRLNANWLVQPLRWTRPRKIFVCAHGDLFHPAVPDDWIDQVFGVMALCPQHIFQVLTKRADRMRRWFSRERPSTAPVECVAALYVDHPETARIWPFDAARAISVGDRGWPLPNVWLGVSCEDQRRADKRVPDLLATPAAVRWVSAEPCLGPTDYTRIACPNGCSPPDYCKRCYPDGRTPTGTFDALATGEIDWIVVGGESGRGARPTHPGWARGVRDQCSAAGVAFLFKQWGEWLPEGQPTGAPIGAIELWRRRFVTIDDGDDRYTRDGAAVHPVGKRRAGRLLDGVEHNGMPKVMHG